MDTLTELFCLIDDFCINFEPAWHERLLADGQKHQRRQTRLQLSDLRTLAVLFHRLRLRQFKSFYLAYACRFLRKEFPDLPSYHRCVELMPRCVIPLAACLTLSRDSAQALRLWTRRQLPCAITSASLATRSLPDSQPGQEFDWLVLRLQAACGH